ncbi:MAG: hypothetical protein AAGF01_08355 [Cyanobacteria bacterium P01_G01_bin.38]
MTLLKQITATTLIGLGSLFVLAAPYSLSKDDVPQPQGVIGYLVMGAPLAAGGVWLWGAARGQTRQSQRALLSAETQRRQTVLYQLIQARQGQFTLIEFAMAANLPGEEARDYLLAQARAFGADYLITETGEIVYQFVSQ